MGERILEFVVEKQRLMRKRDCDFSGLVAGSKGYLKAKFYFSKEWDGCTRIANFETVERDPYPVKLGEDNICLIPHEVLGGDVFHVSVLAGNKSGYRIGTNDMRIKQEVT